jgi:hypothetical protein
LPNVKEDPVLLLPIRVSHLQPPELYARVTTLGVRDIILLHVLRELFYSQCSILVRDKRKLIHRLDDTHGNGAGHVLAIVSHVSE